MSKRSTGKRLTVAEKVDLEVAHAVALPPRRPIGRMVAAVADLGDQPPMVAASAAVLATGLLFDERRTARAGARMLAAMGLATLAKTVLKDRIDRTRPNEAIERNHYRLREGKSREGRLRSMPSGHSAGVVAVARAAARDYPAAAPVLAAGALAVVAAQLPSRAHFLTDVLAGATVGVASEAIATALLRRGGWLA